MDREHFHDKAPRGPRFHLFWIFFIIPPGSQWLRPFMWSQKKSIFSSIFRKQLVYLWDPTCFWILPRFVFFVFFLQLANMILPEDENFLLCFRREAPLKNSVDFMKVSSESVAVARHLLALGCASSRYREQIKKIYRVHICQSNTQSPIRRTTTQSASSAGLVGTLVTAYLKSCSDGLTKDVRQRKNACDWRC